MTAKLETAGVLLSGEAEGKIGHLEGFSGVKALELDSSSYKYGNAKAFHQEEFVKELTWVVKAPAGTEVSLTVSGKKCGSKTASITLL